MQASGAQARQCFGLEKSDQHVEACISEAQHVLFPNWQSCKTKLYLTVAVEIYYLNHFQPTYLSLTQNLSLVRRNALVRRSVGMKDIPDEQALLLLLCDCEYNWFQLIEQV